MDNPVKILGNPNRQNIRYAVADIDSSDNLECVFECVINDLSAHVDLPQVGLSYYSL